MLDRLLSLQDPELKGPYLGFRKKDVIDISLNYFVITDGDNDYKFYKEGEKSANLAQILFYQQVTNRLSEIKDLKLNGYPVKIVPIHEVGVLMETPYSVSIHKNGPNLYQVYNEGTGVINMKHKISALELNESMLQDSITDLSKDLNKLQGQEGRRISISLSKVKYIPEEKTFYVTDLYSQLDPSSTNPQ